MKTFQLFLFLSIAGLPLAAQVQNRESFDPKVTEVWEPKARKVTPGATAGEAPSDAIILFSGRDLAEWT
ncbi:MAG: DUF1080 domain-containing protein, partial [Bacteroidota bacterium]